MITISYSDNLKDSFKILKFDEKSLSKVANNTKATGYGFITLVIAGMLMSLGGLVASIISGSVMAGLMFLTGLIFSPINLIVSLFIVYSVYHFLAKFFFGGKATGIQYFRSLSNSFVIYWFAVIPFISVIANIWLVVINIFILHKVHKLPKGKAIILGLLPIILILLLVFLFLGSTGLLMTTS